MPGKLNVLLVDDSFTSRNMVIAMVREIGHNPFAATNGQEALTILKSENIDLVISDILMPVLDGFGLCLEMKKDTRLKTIPVIYLSGTYKQERDRDFGLYIGAAAYLTKPSDPKTLAETISQVMSAGYFEQNKILFTDKVQSDLKEYSSSVYKEYNGMLIKKLERLLLKHEQNEHKLNTMLSLSSLANETLDDKEYLENTIKIIAKYCNLTRYGVYLLAQNGFDLILTVQSNLPEFYLETMSEVEVGYSFAGKVAARGEILSFPVAEIQSKTQRSMFEKDGIKHIIGFPIASGQGTLGVGLLLFQADPSVNEKLGDLLSSFGKQIGNRLAKQKLVNLIHLSRQKLRAVFDGIEDSIYVINRDYKITSVNKPLAEKLKITPRKIVDTWCYETIWGRSKPCEDCPLREHSGGKTIRHFTLPENKARTTQLYAFPVKSEGAFSNEYILYEKDITTFLTLQEKLPSINKLSTMGLMLGDVIHQLNNSLNSIKGFCDLGKSGKPVPMESVCQQVSSEVDKLINTVRVFTEYAHEKKDEFAIIDLTQVIKEALETVQYKYSLVNISIKLNFHKEQLRVRGNFTKLLNALTNIIINSIQAMPEGGSISFLDSMVDSSRVPQDPGISTKCDKFLLLQIWDTGPGLSQEVTEHLFEPFFTTKDRNLGTGLGLNVARRIMNEHGGTMALDTEYKGGAGFNLYFPV